MKQYSTMFAMFDLDNTLSDRRAAFVEWVAEFVSEYGLPDEANGWIEMLDADGHSARRSVFELIRGRYALKPNVDTLLQRYQSRVVELSRLLPGAVECLEQLRAQGWTTAIVSNGSSEQQNGKVDALGLRRLVGAVVVSADVGFSKPDPTIFRLASERAGADLVGSWMVGDSPANDIVGPARLGINTVWIRRGRQWTETATLPVRMIDSLLELVHIPLTTRRVG